MMTSMIVSLVPPAQEFRLMLGRHEGPLCILDAIAVESMSQRVKNAQKMLCHERFATDRYWLRSMGAGSGLEVFRVNEVGGVL
jgi:hypothetical protein